MCRKSVGTAFVGGSHRPISSSALLAAASAVVTDAISFCTGQVKVPQISTHAEWTISTLKRRKR